MKRKRAKSTKMIPNIQYPDMNKMKIRNFAKVDLIPKKRQKKDIKKELEIMKNSIEPLKCNQSNRKAQIGKNNYLF